MHGRVKVRTSEEQKEIAKREKAKKAAAFSAIMTEILSKRSAGIHDEEALNLTWNLLTENPDIITLWNYRRETFQNMKNEDKLDEYQNLLEKDLKLTEQCLRVNPKSYGSWHHRIWILDNLPHPDWDREMKLCTRYLSLDERNFHCWDYRRTVAEKSRVSDLSEYEFTMEKIETNFSNYSAWHLRSKLLPKIFPDVENRFPVSEEKHREELELVENAAFTDPNDQSAWFYLRWLLNLKEPSPRCLYLGKEDGGLLVVTSKSVKLDGDENIRFGLRAKIEINGKKAKGSWTSIGRHPESCLWTFKAIEKIRPEDLVMLILEENGTERERMPLLERSFSAEKFSFLPELSPDLREPMENQLSSCNQLIELEPESKWTLLTRIFLMSSMDRGKYEEDIKAGLMDLGEIDPLRRGYYRDLRSRLIMEMALEKSESNEKSFSLTRQNLTCLYHSQFLWNREEIDLSFNELTSGCLGRFYTFIRCRILNLNGNHLGDLKSFPSLPNLEVLSIKNNEVREFDLGFLERFPKLKRIELRGNPLVGNVDISEYSGQVEIDCSKS